MRRAAPSGSGRPGAADCRVAAHFGLHSKAHVAHMRDARGHNAVQAQLRQNQQAYEANGKRQLQWQSAATVSGKHETVLPFHCACCEVSAVGRSYWRALQTARPALRSMRAALKLVFCCQWCSLQFADAEDLLRAPAPTLPLLPTQSRLPWPSISMTTTTRT